MKVALLLSFLVTLSVLSPSQAQSADEVVIQTSLGEIVLRLDRKKAPVTSKNFLRYVEQGLFTNGQFYRTVTLAPDNQPNNKVKIEVIQGGLSPSKEAQALAPIPLERTNTTGLRHRDGTISMARLEPDSASSEFFICLGEQKELDYGGKRNPDGQGFAAFGQVVGGMDVVRKIHRSKAQGQSLEPPILIQSVRRRP